jgi:hypothetical protein
MTTVNKTGLQFHIKSRWFIQFMQICLSVEHRKEFFVNVFRLKCGVIYKMSWLVEYLSADIRSKPTDQSCDRCKTSQQIIHSSDYLAFAVWKTSKLEQYEYNE